MKKSGDKSPAIFLDRDGTLIEEVGYLNKPDQIRVIPGAAEALRIFNRLHFKTIIISNQSGIARGYFDEPALHSIHRKLMSIFDQENAQIDGIYFCPHHPEGVIEQYRQACECRKPGSGLIMQAVKEHSIDLNHSVMIGDKLTDIETGKRLNLFSILVQTGYGGQELNHLENVARKYHPDAVVANLPEAAKLISDFTNPKKDV